MGKVQGTRTKRKRFHPEPESTTSQHSRETSINGLTQLQDRAEGQEVIDLNDASVTSPKRHAPDPLEQTLRDWSTSQSWTLTNWDNGDLSMDIQPTMFDDYINDNSNTSQNNFATPELSDITTITDSTSASGNPRALPALPTPVSVVALPALHVPAKPKPPPEPTDKEFERSMAKIDSRCVLACANIITTLENYLLSELKVLDLILSTVRTVADELRKLIQHQQQSRSDRCMLLFVTIMHQIVTLFEVGTREAFDDQGHEESGNSASDDQSSFMPKLGFGAFSINAEEQKAWKSRIIRRELENTTELLAGVTALCRLGPRGGSTDPADAEERVKCISGIDRRLRVLGERAGA